MANQVDISAKIKGILDEYLERKGLRKTTERYEVLKEIYRHDEHFDANLLFDRINKTDLSISRATVYNSLELFLACGLVVQYRFSTSPLQYEQAYKYRQHDHLICTECKHIVEFCEPRLYPIEQDLGDLLNFKILHHALLLYGRCTDKGCPRKKANI